MGAVKVKLEQCKDGKTVHFKLLSGPEPLFHRILSPYGVPGIVTLPTPAVDPAVAVSGAPAAERIIRKHYFVPTSASKLACVALSRKGAELFADGGVQAAIERATWKCEREKLFPYQKQGAEFLRSRRRAMLCDQMGLGKTICALAALDETKPALVIVPPIVLGNWYAEARRWRPDLDVAIWKRPYGIFLQPGELCLATYSTLPSECLEERTRCPYCGRLSVVPFAFWEADRRSKGEMVAGAVVVSPFKDVCDTGRGGRCGPAGRRFNQSGDEWIEHAWIGDRPKYPVQLVVDEAHYCKTRDSDRTTAVRAIAAECASVWLLTGTPLLNTPAELWSLCQLFPGVDERDPFDTGAQAAFGSWQNFVRLFGGKKKYFGGYDWPSSGVTDPEAPERLGSLMLRRMRTEVMPDLPTKIRRVLDVDIAAPIDPAIRERLLAWSDDEVLRECAPDGSLSQARKDLADLKLPALQALLKECEAGGEPVIVFSYHRGPIELLGKKRGWGCITGSTSSKDRTKLVAAFQAGKLKGIAGTIGAMGVGVTLTHSAYVYFIDRDYVPANNLQAEDRLVRIGQTRGVLVTVLKCKHPIDGRVEGILARKEALLEAMNLSEDPGEGVDQALS